MLFLFFLFLGAIFSADLTVVQTFILSRHGDRTPMTESVIPSCPIDISRELGLVPRTLTANGENQLYKLGQSLRERYLDPKSETRLEGISEGYDSEQYLFVSDLCKRTIRSLWAVTEGLFYGKGKKIDTEPFECALPQCGQSVPILVDTREDRIVAEIDFCSKVHQNANKYYQTAEGQAYISKYDDKVALANKLCGYSDWQSKKFTNMVELYDVITVLKSHGYLEKECKDINDNYDLFVELANANWNIQLSNEIALQNLTGTFVYNAAKIMMGLEPENQQDLLEMERGMYGYNIEPTKTRKVKYGRRFSRKYYHYSGHDSGLASVMSSLELRKDYEELNILPPYGSAFIIEVVRNETSQDYFVRVIFKEGYDGEFKAYKLKSFGCNDVLCPIEKFYGLVKSKLYFSNEEWCSICENKSSVNCLKKNLF